MADKEKRSWAAGVFQNLLEMMNKSSLNSPVGQIAHIFMPRRESSSQSGITSSGSEPPPAGGPGSDPQGGYGDPGYAGYVPGDSGAADWQPYQTYNPDYIPMPDQGVTVRRLGWQPLGQPPSTPAYSPYGVGGNSAIGGWSIGPMGPGSFTGTGAQGGLGFWGGWAPKKI